jgi:hypothetical protein
MTCAQTLWRGTQLAGLAKRKRLRQPYSISARPGLHSSPELHYRWTAVFLRKPGSFERVYTWCEVTERRPDPTPCAINSMIERRDQKSRSRKRIQQSKQCLGGSRLKMQEIRTFYNNGFFFRRDTHVLTLQVVCLQGQFVGKVTRVPF